MLTLAALLDPVPVERFRSAHWERAPLLIERGEPEHFAALLSHADVDALLQSSPLLDATIRLLQGGKKVEVKQLRGESANAPAAVLEHVYDEFRRGTSFTLQGIQERWAPARELARVLADELSARTSFNVYVTPPNGSALPPHYDTHDVFVLQIEGHKRWTLHERVIDLPFESERTPPDLALPDTPLQTFTLARGDTLYIPRGFSHSAVAGDETSIHLTVGIHGLTWAKLTRMAIESILEAHPEFRRSLPPGFALDPERLAEAHAGARAMFDLVLADLDPARWIASAVVEARRARIPELDGHFLDLVASDHLTPATVLHRRPRLHTEYALTETHAELSFHAKTLRFPAHVDPCLRAILERDRCSAAALPDALDDAGKLVLVRRLLREGFLTTRPATEPPVRP